MGDLATHGSIAEKVMAVLEHDGPKDANGITQDDYIFFELGNFLTDVSQLRDPPSWMAARKKVWDKAREKHYAWTLKNIADLDEYLPELLGTPGVHGKLPQFLREMAYLIGCEKFVNAPGSSMTAKEYDRIYRKIDKEPNYKGFTQYWPHEHLDFPPGLTATQSGTATGPKCRGTSVRRSLREKSKRGAIRSSLRDNAGSN